MSKETLLEESMGEFSFEEMFIEKVLLDIKKRVKESIDLDEDSNFEECCDMPEKGRTEITDEVMRGVLRHLLVSTEKQEEMKTRYNFLMFLDGNKEIGTRRFISLMMLYYTAIYFDSLELLKEYIKNDDFFYYPDDVVLCCLDKVFISYIDKERLESLIKNRRHFFNTFYKGMKGLKESDKIKYYQKFANIMDQKIDMPDMASKYFTKAIMDIYDEEDYLNATPEQFENNFADGEIISGDAEAFAKLKWIINNSDYSASFFINSKLMYGLFTAEELIENKFSYLDGIYFGNANLRECDMGRVKNIYNLNKEIIRYDDFLHPEILKMYDDVTIASFPRDLIIELMELNLYTIRGEFPLEKKNEIEQIVNRYMNEKKKGKLRLLFKR